MFAKERVFLSEKFEGLKDVGVKSYKTVEFSSHITSCSIPIFHSIYFNSNCSIILHRLIDPLFFHPDFNFLCSWYDKY